MKTPEFLDSIYVPDKEPSMRQLMEEVVEDLNTCIEEGLI